MPRDTCLTDLSVRYSYDLLRGFFSLSWYRVIQHTSVHSARWPFVPEHVNMQFVLLIFFYERMLCFAEKRIVYYSKQKLFSDSL